MELGLPFLLRPAISGNVQKVIQLNVRDSPITQWWPWICLVIVHVFYMYKNRIAVKLKKQKQYSAASYS